MEILDIECKKDEHMTEQKAQGRYLTHTELEQFKMDCPICGITVNLIQFSEHLREDIKRNKDGITNCKMHR